MPKKERDLQALTRQMLRPVINILTGHTQEQNILSLMRLSNDPFAVIAKRHLRVLPTFSAIAITLKH